MSKRILFITESPEQTVGSLARLCKISSEKFEAIFDLMPLYHIATKWDKHDAHLRGCQILRDTSHPFIVLVGSRVAQAFTVDDHAPFYPFPLSFDEGDGVTNKQVRAATTIIPTSNHKWYQKPANTRQAMLMLGDLVQVSGVASAPKDITAVMKTVEELGGDLSWWTKKLLAEMKSNFAEERIIDRIDLVQIMQSYANDCKFKTNKEKNEDLQNKE